MKIGRNDKCHCGSGKKYKKCCLHLDEERKIAFSRPVTHDHEEEFLEDYDDDELNDSFESEEEMEEDSSCEDDFYEDDTSCNNSLYPCKKFEENILAIAEAEQRIVDEWWQKFKKVYSQKKIDHIKCLELIKDFSKNHPTLVSNLYLHEEAIFELDSAFLKAGDYDIFIDFLIWFRQDYFDAYRLSGTYYDISIISYLLVHNRTDEIPQYFSLFIEYPDHDPDNLLKLINMLRASNNQNLLNELLKDIYLHIYYSHNVIGGDSFVVPVLETIFYRHFKRNYSDDDLDCLLSDVKEIASKVPDIGIYTDREHWKNLFEETFCRKFGDDYPKSKQDIEKYYGQVINHFTSYLCEAKNKEWITASYYSSLVRNYLWSFLEKNKKPKHLFSFNKKMIDSYIAKNFRSFFSLNEIPSLAFLDALKLFVEYLKGEDLISLDEMTNADKVCNELFQTVYSICSQGDYTSNIFTNHNEHFNVEL